jgi:hypothetical protein
LTTRAAVVGWVGEDLAAAVGQVEHPRWQLATAATDTEGERWAAAIGPESATRYLVRLALAC